MDVEDKETTRGLLLETASETARGSDFGNPYRGILLFLTDKSYANCPAEGSFYR